MKRLFSVISLAVGLGLSMNVMAQKMTEDATKAQKALVDYLRTEGMAPSIDTRDNSVCFKSNEVFYWVTFDGTSPVLYTIHRKGLKFDQDSTFKSSCARYACNMVNLKHKIKCTYGKKRVEFILQTYAKEPSDFHGGFRKMLAAFKGVDATYKENYNKAYDKSAKDSIERYKPIIPDTPIGNSPLTVTNIAFGNFDAAGNMISDYDQALRKSACRFIKASVYVTCAEKGIFKLGVKIVSPDGKAMLATKGVEYSATANVEIKKPDKEQECILGPYGSDKADFWKAGEYKVEIYDFEKGAKLYSTTFTIL